MPIPKGYEFLSTIGTLPKMVQEALKLVGTIETPGKGSNPTIMAWAKEAAVKGYSDDAVPWCGLFMSVVAKRAGKTAPEAPLWALNWKSFGTPQTKPALGDVLTFKRDGGGHVTMYIGEDDSSYHVLGGNQSDAVTITRIAKTRLHSISRPSMSVPPASLKPYHLKASGSLSSNEK
jgi:uncharacterized protein (TIGR02594 family)